MTKGLLRRVQLIERRLRAAAPDVLCDRCLEAVRRELAGEPAAPADPAHSCEQRIRRRHGGKLPLAMLDDARRRLGRLDEPA